MNEPFTWAQFPILDYTITIYNDTQPPHMYTYTVTDLAKHMTVDTEATSCDNLRFFVSARNERGVSKNGSTSGGFPVGEFL